MKDPKDIKKNKSGFVFTPFEKKDQSPFERLFDIFMELITYTSGDVYETLDWMHELDKEYNLFSAEYTMDDFIEDLKKRGFIKDDNDNDGGNLAITSKTERAIRKNALDQIFGKMKRSRSGNHRTNYTGKGDEQTGEFRNYQFGDNLANISLTESLKNAQINNGIGDFSMTENDLVVEETNFKAQMSTVLMIDISHSMILYGEDRITPAKKVAMALAELITTRYPKDTLDIIVFGNDAWPIKLKDLPYLQVGPYHTNTVAGLQLAMDILRRKRNTNKQIFMITDGKPSCLRMPDGQYYKNSFGLDDLITDKCYTQARQARKLRIPITTFMIAQDEYLQAFIAKFTEENQGKAFYTGLKGLGEMIFEDYETNRKRELMANTKIKTFGELKKAGYKYQSIKDELRKNLLEKLDKKEDIFPEFWGFENTVIPQVQRAILSKHNLNFLGLRGQAKTKMARALVTLLDEYIPYVAGSEICDDPFAPISKYSVDLMEEKGDDTPVAWLHRDERFFEKLATPDVTVADLIGDIDPIKAATLKLSYSDERVLHYGMIPRANRSIFVINELPDLQARIQVALFNILQEGDIQIRGFKLRMPLDLQFIFTANPEDYTNRGSIVTPLKDRIGSQIITHYPKTIEIAKKITAQEAKKLEESSVKINVPELARDIIEQISFEARKSDFVDIKSGVSARTSITAFENLLSTAELRALKSGEKETTIRLSDFVGVIPAITGKVELVYEGEQEGAEKVAELLINEAIKTLFVQYYPEIKKLERQNAVSPYQDVVDWFYNAESFELLDDYKQAEYDKALSQIKPLTKLIREYQPETSDEDLNFSREFILWALVEFKKLSKQRTDDGFEYLDRISSYAGM